MAKYASFGKRENEKKKQASRVEKQNRKEERKSSGKATSFEDMIAYVDEAKGFGFIRDLSGTEKYFFHVNNVVDDISVNDIVTFDLERGDRGLSAVNVCLENK